MSNPGQPIDPVMALAAQQQTAPAPYFPPGDSRNSPAAVSVTPQAIDPVEALASGHVASVSSSSQSPVPTEASGLVPTIVRGITNAATFNLADPLAAAADATIPLDKGSSSAPDWLARFKENLSSQRSATNEGQQAHPYVALGSSVAGGIANPVARALPVAQSLGGAVLQGASLGAGYGAGGAIGNSQDISDALKQTATGAGFGAAAGAGSQALGKLLSGATRSPQAQLLADEGVPLTMGQSLGGTPKTLEDASTHIPMMGNAIKGRQNDSLVGFNRATYNRVLEPLGLSYDKTAPIGNGGIQELDKVIGRAYDKAYNGAAVTNSPGLQQDLQSAIQNAANTLPQDRVNSIQGNITRLLTSKFGQSGQLSNNDLQTAKNWFAEQSRVGPAANMDEKAIGKTYGSVVDALKDEIGANDPTRKDLLNAADNAFMRYVKVSQAASQNNASAREGLFTPSQFGAALRTTEQSTRRMNFAKGIAPMQDLAQAGQAILPSSVPDSGTALRGLLELGAGGAITHEISPEAALGGAGLIGSGTALYSRPGQALARALLHGAPNARRAMGAIPPTMLPGFVAALTASGGSKP